MKSFITTVTIDTGKKIIEAGEVVTLEDDEADRILKRHGGTLTQKDGKPLKGDAEVAPNVPGGPTVTTEGTGPTVMTEGAGATVSGA